MLACSAALFYPCTVADDDDDDDDSLAGQKTLQMVFDESKNSPVSKQVRGSYLNSTFPKSSRWYVCQIH